MGNNSAEQSPRGAETFTIDAAMVKHVAYLVRLGILEEEAQAFSHQFTDIIDYFHLLNEVNTDEVPPASEISSTRSVMPKVPLEVPPEVPVPRSGREPAGAKRPAAAPSAALSVRADEVRPSMPREDFLKNVPRVEGAFVRVPQVFGEE